MPDRTRIATSPWMGRAAAAHAVGLVVLATLATACEVRVTFVGTDAKGTMVVRAGEPPVSH